MFLDPDPPRIVSVRYLSQSRVKIAWKASKCNFDNVRRIYIQRGDVVFGLRDVLFWNSETETGYQIFDDVTSVVGDTYDWSIRVTYGEGDEETESQSSPVFAAVVVGESILYLFSQCGFWLMVSFQSNDRQKT